MRTVWLCMALASVGAPAYAEAQTPGEHPVNWSLRGGRISVLAGDTVRVALHATIGEFFHLYSTTQGPGGPVRTTLEAFRGQHFSLVGRVRARAPDTIPDGNFGIMTEVYDDSVTLSVTLHANTALSPGPTSALLGVRYQAC